MMGLVRSVAAGAIGAAVAIIIPRAGLLAATQEIIGFLSLLMAGLLPAMVITATILRGDGFSARRLDEYGGGLALQLRFWAVLFAAAGLATLGVVGAKVFAADGVTVRLAIRDAVVLTDDRLTTAFLLIFGAGTGVVLQRLVPAYQGLHSLLILNVSMARAAALANDRSIADALQADAAASKPPPEYAKMRAGGEASDK